MTRGKQWDTCDGMAYLSSVTCIQGQLCAQEGEVSAAGAGHQRQGFLLLSLPR